MCESGDLPGRRNGVLVDAFATDNLGTPRERARYQQAVAKL